jgi:hypothetical protein
LLLQPLPGRGVTCCLCNSIVIGVQYDALAQILLLSVLILLLQSFTLLTTMDFCTCPLYPFHPSDTQLPGEVVVCNSNSSERETMYSEPTAHPSPYSGHVSCPSTIQAEEHGHVGRRRTLLVPLWNQRGEYERPHRVYTAKLARRHRTNWPCSVVAAREPPILRTA